MFQTIAIVILLGIIIYLIFDKKGIKTDDVKAFLKNIGIKTKEKISVFFEKVKSCFQKLRTRIEEFKQKRAESKRRQDELNKQIELHKQLHKQDSVDSIEENTTESNLVPEKNKKTLIIAVSIITCLLLLVDFLIAENAFTFFVIILLLLVLALFIILMIKFRWFRRLMLVALILFICIAPFAYKKVILDYDGKYATDRLVYTEEFGFCMLITYYPNYQSGNAKGIAITNIPFIELFSHTVQANKYGDDTADSKDLLYTYQELATLGDNALVDSLAKFLLDSKLITKSIQIGKYGNYFATNFKDCYSRPNSIDSIHNSIENIENEYSTEDDYSPILIRP